MSEPSGRKIGKIFSRKMKFKRAKQSPGAIQRRIEDFPLKFQLKDEV
jgi:hypothetical protein